MGKYYLVTKNLCNWFLQLKGLLWFLFQFHGHLKGRPNPLQEVWASQSEAGPLPGRPDLAQEGRVAHREARFLSENQALLGGGQASQRFVGPLIGSPGLSLGGQASHREGQPLTGRPGLSQGGRASHREAGPLNRFIQNLQKILFKFYNLSNIQVSIMHKLQHFVYCYKAAKKFTLLSSQNPFGLGTLFPRSSAFW